MTSKDGAHCLRALCAHPCCWESARRVRGGAAPRVVAPPLSYRDKKASLEEDSLSTLSVVNASEWTSGPKTPNVSLLPWITDSVSMVTEPTGVPRTHPLLPRQREGGVASTSVKTRSPETVSGPLSPLQWSLGQRSLKLGTGQISPVPGHSTASWRSGPAMTWVPSPHYVHQNLHREKPPQVSIKELTCFPPAELNPSIKKKSKQKKKKKKRLSFQERLVTGSGSDDDLGHPRPRPSSSSPLRGHLLILLSPADRTVVADPRMKDGLRPLSTAVIHVTQERVWSGPKPRDRADYRYRLAPESAVEGVDRDNLRRQTYLWRTRKRSRRHLPPAGPAQESRPSLAHGFASGLHPVAMAAPSSHSKSPLSTGASEQRSGRRILACESRPHSYEHTNHTPHMITEDPVHRERIIDPRSSPPPPCGILSMATLPRKPGARSHGGRVVKFAEMHRSGGPRDRAARPENEILLTDEIPSEVTPPPPPPCSLASDEDHAPDTDHAQ